MVWPSLCFLSAYSFMHWITKNGMPLGFPRAILNKGVNQKECRIFCLELHHLQYCSVSLQ
jgi:hypothetical protein